MQVEICNCLESVRSYQNLWRRNAQTPGVGLVMWKLGTGLHIDCSIELRSHVSASTRDCSRFGALTHACLSSCDGSRFHPRETHRKRRKNELRGEQDNPAKTGGRADRVNSPFNIRSGAGTHQTYGEGVTLVTTVWGSLW